MTGIPELLVLGLLKERDEMYGYEIVTAIGSATGEVVSLKEGVVYPLLHGLEREGMLKSQRRDADGRSRTYYALTAMGIRRLFELTDEWRRLQRAVDRILA